MKTMVSVCLAGENCNYYGGNNWNENVLQLMADNETIIVFPEQMGGFPTPRISAENKEGMFTVRDDQIVNVMFREGAGKFLEVNGTG